MSAESFREKRRRQSCGRVTRRAFKSRSIDYVTIEPDEEG
jgi:hypothetical protein